MRTGEQATFQLHLAGWAQGPHLHLPQPHLLGQAPALWGPRLPEAALQGADLLVLEGRAGSRLPPAVCLLAQPWGRTEVPGIHLATRGMGSERTHLLCS